MKFDKIFSRADEELLQDILGDQAIRLLSTLDETRSYNKYLRELVLMLHGQEGILINQSLRSLIIDLLREEEAMHLAKIVGINNYNTTAELYSKLKNKRIRRGSTEEENLFRFFELLPPDNEDNEIKESTFSTTPNNSLFKHQRQAVYEINYHLGCEPFRVMLHMPTGSGKTRTAMNVIAEHLRNNEPTVVVWLANTEELCEQAIEEFNEIWTFLGNRSVNVQRFWGPHSVNMYEVKDGFVVAGLAKMVSSIRSSDGIKFISELANKCSVIIMDEAHQAIAPTYRLVLDALAFVGKKSKLLGLTATPGRTWNDVDADKELADFFCKKKVTLRVEGYDNPIDYLVDQKYIAKVNYRPLFYNNESLDEKDIEEVANSIDVPINVLIRLGEDHQRNLKILYETEVLLSRHNRVLLFAPSVESSNIYACVLNARGFKAFSLTGSTPHPKRRDIIEEFRSNYKAPIVICNYGILTAGFDAPKTSAALIARPTKSLVLYSQMVGRATRGIKASGNEEAEVVTIIDTELPGFRNIAESFNNWEDVW